VNIAGFTIKNATGSYKVGIYLGTGVEHCNVSDNYVSNNDCGIRLYKSSNNTITNNIASSNSKFGIYLYSSSNNILADNSANSNNLDGIRLRSHSNNNTLTNNIANSNSEAGILCWTSSDNILTYNNINLNAYAIWLHNSSCYNILANNSANSNDKYGICIFSSSNNMIYLNDFLNNNNNVYSYKSTNLFNSSSEIKYTYKDHTYTNYLGNYWSDYNGNDADGDGIGDTPYTINSDKDNYPLMEPFENYFAPTKNVFDTG
jgi:parallel beta-helix repeat protein